MFKKFSFLVIFLLAGSIGSVVSIHWNTLKDQHARTEHVHRLYKRESILDSMTLSLERYRRLSSGFRKLSDPEIIQIKNRLKTAFTEGVSQLDQLNPTAEEYAYEHEILENLEELFRLITHFEPMLFTKDAYQKPDVLDVHERILKSLSQLGKSADQRLASFRLDSSHLETRSLFLLLGAGSFIFILMLALILKNYITYIRPLRKLHLYAEALKSGQSLKSQIPHFTGLYSEIQSVINQLAHAVEVHIRDRHKFISDIVADLKEPLSMLKKGRALLSESDQESSADKDQALELVRRGLVISSGSLDDLNDIVDINRIESRLEERTVDLSELIKDVSKTLLGSEASKKIVLDVPPIPVWSHLDLRRIERVLFLTLTKVIQTLPHDHQLAIALIQNSKTDSRGVKIVLQDAERLKSGRVVAGGPEQDLMKHWISENGLSMVLAHRIIKAHGGSIFASGVIGTSVTISIKLPQERIMSQGLITYPREDMVVGLARSSASSQ